MNKIKKSIAQKTRIYNKIKSQLNPRKARFLVAPLPLVGYTFETKEQRQALETAKLYFRGF